MEAGHDHASQRVLAAAAPWYRCAVASSSSAARSQEKQAGLLWQGRSHHIPQHSWHHEWRLGLGGCYGDRDLPLPPYKAIQSHEALSPLCGQYDPSLLPDQVWLQENRWPKDCRLAMTTGNTLHTCISRGYPTCSRRRISLSLLFSSPLCSHHMDHHIRHRVSPPPGKHH